MFRILCFVWFTCPPLVCLGYAQELGKAALDPGRSELTYFLQQQDATKAAGSRLQALMDELQKKYAADPNGDLREQIREGEAFATKLQNLRSDAQRLANPALLPSLDLLVSNTQESTNNLKSDLNAHVRAPNPDWIALKGRIDKLQREIDLNKEQARPAAPKGGQHQEKLAL